MIEIGGIYKDRYVKTKRWINVHWTWQTINDKDIMNSGEFMFFEIKVTIKSEMYVQ